MPLGMAFVSSTGNTTAPIVKKKYRYFKAKIYIFHTFILLLWVLQYAETFICFANENINKIPPKVRYF